MSIRDRQRIFSLRYRKSPQGLFREPEGNLDRQPDGIHKVGDIWHEENGTEVWVHMAVPHFETPSSKYEMERMDKLFQRCELSAEHWIQERFPGNTLQ